MEPSKQLAQSFQLQLSSQWQNWFDQQAHQVPLAGGFKIPVDVAKLCQSTPEQIWPGFMLPDSIPILGNGYGDWICARINGQSQIDELIHWYHGGGDWVPVGQTMVEAVVHDAIDQYRPMRKQMLRGATESIKGQMQPIIADRSLHLQNWLQDLDVQDPWSKWSNDLISALTLSAVDYRNALERLLEIKFAYEACACDLIEYQLHSAFPSENSSIQQMPPGLAKELLELCQQVNSRREDLGWSHTIQGICHIALGDKASAVEAFFRGRQAASFSDQSVRMRLHRFEYRYGKYSISQLARLKGDWSKSMIEDEYLSACLTYSGTLVQSIQSYWLKRAVHAQQEGQPGEAYDCFYRAGWDVGADSMVSYRKILQQLERTALDAGWPGRAAVARAHLLAM